MGCCRENSECSTAGILNITALCLYSAMIFLFLSFCSFSSDYQEAETKAATAEERERSVNERLSQTLSRINVLEAQVPVAP